ncbi:hypothetical protein KUCAC02_036841 [Chaenocephalus aceratus]|nr:hypothetical protein KUCAC02_036841 [Chaenocephalus aceratus]
MVLLSAKNPQPSSVSPKPSTQRNSSGTSSRNTSGSTEKPEGKDSSVGSRSKTSADASPDPKTASGSKESLESKSRSASKTSSGSKDSLDSKDNLDLKHPSNLQASSRLKAGPTRSTSKPSLVASKTDLVESATHLTSRTGSKDLNEASSSAKATPDAKAGFDYSNSGPVRSSSTLALADLSPSSSLPPPRPSPGNRSPAYGSGNTLGSSPTGPTREVLKSPGSAQGPVAPLATSSPKIRTTVSLTMTRASAPWCPPWKRTPARHPIIPACLGAHL